VNPTAFNRPICLVWPRTASPIALPMRKPAANAATIPNATRKTDWMRSPKSANSPSISWSAARMTAPVGSASRAEVTAAS
jgi:hypothetical protein